MQSSSPKPGFLRLALELDRSKHSHIFILEGEREETAQLASALAAHFGRALHKVTAEQDWKALIGKIPAAEQAKAILFFDEADALLGKRTNVQESRDRYAELDSAFRGIVLLGVNKTYVLPAAFTQCCRTVVVRNYWS